MTPSSDPHRARTSHALPAATAAGAVVDSARVLEISRRDANRRVACRLLDVRPRAELSRGHVPGSAALSVEGSAPTESELAPHLLPRPGSSIVVFGSKPVAIDNVWRELRGRGYEATACAEPIRAEMLEPGPARGALWSPAPFLQECEPSLPSPEMGPVLDLGAGSGRDSVYLAGRGYDCVLAERLPDALAKAEDRARRYGVSVRSVVTDLREPDGVPPGPYGLVLSVRFLLRPWLERSADLVRPGGCLVLDTFGELEPGDPASPIRAKFRLGRGEVSRWLDPAQWEMVVPPRSEVREGERWISLLARRRGS